MDTLCKEMIEQIQAQQEQERRILAICTQEQLNATGSPPSMLAAQMGPPVCIPQSGLQRAVFCSQRVNNSAGAFNPLSAQQSHGSFIYEFTSHGFKKIKQ